MGRKLRVLVISYLPWRGDNNTGNSYTNIFKGCEDKYEFAQIYFRDGMPQNNFVHKYYLISEMKLLRRFLGKREPVGKSFEIEDSSNSPKDTFSRAYDKARVLRWEIFFLVRELVGLSNAWKTREFDDFLDAFKPDLVFATLSTEPVSHRVMWYVQNRFNIPLVTYPWDDYYSLKHVNLSPFFWIRKFYGRHFIRKSVRRSSFLYVISGLMKREYEKIFHRDCHLLFKGRVFDEKDCHIREAHDPIQMLYMGNILLGRWQTLAQLAKAIKQVNDEYGETKFYMNVYTLSPTNEKMRKALNIEGSSQINPPVENEMVDPTMERADILLHAEPCKLSQMQTFRMSFSTKLADCFYHAKCIMAIGGNTASLEYLEEQDAAIVVKKGKSLYEALKRILADRNIIAEYARKGWECGFRNHQIKDIQAAVYKDLLGVIGEREKR